MNELKLCPFCGGVASLRTEIRPPSHVSDKYGYVASIDHNCTNNNNIRAHGLELFYSDKNDDETVSIYDAMTKHLVSAWNNRPLDYAIDAKNMRMKTVLSWYLEQEKISDIDIMHTIDLRAFSNMAKEALK